MDKYEEYWTGTWEHMSQEDKTDRLNQLRQVILAANEVVRRNPRTFGQDATLDTENAQMLFNNHGDGVVGRPRAETYVNIPVRGTRTGILGEKDRVTGGLLVEADQVLYARDASTVKLQKKGLVRMHTVIDATDTANQIGDTVAKKFDGLCLG